MQLAKDTALLTHTNKHGFNGAILQALAVYNVVYAEASIDKKEFIGKLKHLMSKVEGVKLDKKRLVYLKNNSTKVRLFYSISSLDELR